MTRSEIKSALKSAGIENFDGEARILIEEFGTNEAALHRALIRRCNREPLQYIIGRWSFFREEYFVSPDCLIPRSDTEVLVEHLVKTLPKGAHFLDLCTGSGCIAISLAKNRPDLVGAAADISERALALAKKNAVHNRVSSLRIFHTDVTKPSELTESFDCITANPPYITATAMKMLEPELTHEPRIALCGGEDGLDFYRAILKNYADNLRKDGCFAFEFGYDQKEDAAALAAAYDCSFFEIYDYGGNFRAAILKKRGSST